MTQQRKRYRVKRNKYGAQPTVVDGIRFASKREARRWQELKLLEKGKQISGLRRQLRYPLEVYGELIATYVADFVYYPTPHDSPVVVVEDTKGVRTPEYKLKAKLMKAIYGITILET